MTDRRDADGSLMEGPMAGEAAALWLGAIIESSFDAILSKSLDGIITSWNHAAETMFGYRREEAVGRPITLIIPDDRLHEEEEIIARLHKGERIEQFETVRCTRDGRPIDIELTVSPVRDASGRIIGASSIARDISERRRQAEAQALLLREMNHRIKNLMTIVQRLISVGRRRAGDIQDFADGLSGQIQALSSAHQLVLGALSKNTSLPLLLDAILAPYYAHANISIEALEAPVGAGAITSLALAFHELATNAVKYGGLSRPDGQLAISTAIEDDRIVILWRETGGSAPDSEQQGFGSRLLQSAIHGLEGTYSQVWQDGLFETKLLFPVSRIAG